MPSMRKYEPSKLRAGASAFAAMRQAVIGTLAVRLAVGGRGRELPTICILRRETMTAVVFLSGPSGNDALGAAGRAHRSMFESLGHEFIELGLGQADARELLNETIRERKIEFVYSAVGIGAGMRGT